jgi:enamine deaminase RidA (YjgF/YER057c/UK114 family)
MRKRTLWTGIALTAALLFASGSALAGEPKEKAAASMIDVYDEAAYTQYVEDTMKKLDQLYLDFCGTCGVDASKAYESKQEFLVTVRDLMQHMNARYDKLDPKTGAALSPTETLVSIHAMTMLIDILAQTQIEQMAVHPYIE